MKNGSHSALTMHDSSADASNFSVVIPVHNEANMLACTLPSITKLNPREVIFILDRCTDSTENLIKKFWKRFDILGIDLILFKVKKRSKWGNHLNFLYHIGSKKATSQFILFSQADIQHDYVEIKKSLHRDFNGMLSFAVLEHPHIAPWNHFVTKMLQTIGVLLGVQPFSGVIAFSKKQYLACPLTPVDTLNFDTQIQTRFIEKGNACIFVKTKNLNLRPALVFRGERSKLWNVGIDRFRLKKPLLKVLSVSAIRITPQVIAGYLHARMRNLKNTPEFKSKESGINEDSNLGL